MTTATPTACDKRGDELSLYYNTGDSATPVWVLHVGLVGDLTFNETDDEQELSIRNPAQLIKEYLAGRTDLSISGTQVLDDEYEGCLFLTSMRAGGEPRDVLVLTGTIDTVGVVGFRGKWYNVDRTATGPETGPPNRNFNLRPAACTDTPVRAVRVAVADTIADYDPTQWSAAAGMGGEAAQQRLNQMLIRSKRDMVLGLQRTGAEYVYVDAGKVSAILGTDVASELTEMLVQTDELIRKNKCRSATRMRATTHTHGIGEFQRVLLLDALKDSSSYKLDDLDESYEESPTPIPRGSTFSRRSELTGKKPPSPENKGGRPLPPTSSSPPSASPPKDEA